MKNGMDEVLNWIIAATVALGLGMVVMILAMIFTTPVALGAVVIFGIVTSWVRVAMWSFDIDIKWRE